MWNDWLWLFVNRTIGLIRQYNEQDGSQSLEDVIQAITQMASHPDLTDDMIISCFKANGSVEVFKVLQDKFKAGISILNCFHILHAVCSKGAYELVEELVVRHGLDINKVDWFGQTPLTMAVVGGHVEVAAFLLRHPDFNKMTLCKNFLWGKSHKGVPALECALAALCREGIPGPKMVNMEKMMKLLFENGADATALDAEGDSMLENAATPKRLYNGKINHDLQVHARKVVQYLAEDIGLPVTDKVIRSSGHWVFRSSNLQIIRSSDN